MTTAAAHRHHTRRKPKTSLLLGPNLSPGHLGGVFLYAVLFGIIGIPLAATQWQIGIEDATAVVSVLAFVTYLTQKVVFTWVLHKLVEDDAAHQCEPRIPQLMLWASMMLAVFFLLLVVTAIFAMSGGIYWALQFTWAVGPTVQLAQWTLVAAAAVFGVALLLIVANHHDAAGIIQRQIHLAACMLDEVHSKLAHQPRTIV